jgi:hypothetical protein
MAKHLLYGVVTFAIIGAACGVAVGMLTCYRPEQDKVRFDDGLPLALIGLLLGAVIGCWVSMQYHEHAAIRTWVEVLAPALLLGSTGAVIGWVLGDKWVRNPPPSMTWGGVIGIVLGLCCGFVQVLDRLEGHDVPSPELIDLAEDLLSRAARLDIAGEWDAATAVYETVLNNPEYAEHHEFARNSIQALANKRSAGSLPPETGS